MDLGPILRFVSSWAALAAAVVIAGAAIDARAAVINVPNDQPTIQDGINAAGPGDVVEVETGIYNEQLTFPTDGMPGLPIVLQAAAGHAPVIDGTGRPVNGLSGLVYIENRSHVHVVGFEIRNFRASSGTDFPSGIWVRGEADGIELRDNVVHAIENDGCADCGAHAIAAYGTSMAGSINNLVIDGNTVRNCVLGWSEALVLNGNVENWIVSNNVVHDNNNIGIDIIGFEGECVGCPDDLDRARDGEIVGNHVFNIDTFGNPSYGTERSAGGIYVDGGTRIVIERNVVHDANLGIELASEHAGKDTSLITVRNNLVYGCHGAGFAMGGFDTMRGRTELCSVVNNTFFQNDTDANGFGEITLQFDTRDNTFRNNLVFAGSQNVFVTNYFDMAQGNTFDFNLYFSTGGAASSEWSWMNMFQSGLAEWRMNTGQDLNSLFMAPLLVDPAQDDFRVEPGSPAIDAGEDVGVLIRGDVDADGASRLAGGGIDIGAYEFQVANPCMPLPGRVEDLRLAKQGADLAVSWTLEPDSGAYAAYSIDTLGGQPARGSNPAAMPVCTSPNGMTTSCVRMNGLTEPGPALLFYQVVGACATDPTVEGPN